MENDQTTLELNYNSNINPFCGRERTEQKILNINTHGLVRMLGKSTKIRSTGVEPKRKERSFSTQLISQERVLPWRLTALRETDLSGFSAQMLLEVFTESRISWEREGSIYRCMPTVLILTFVFLSCGFLSFFSHSFLCYLFVSFFFLSFYFLVEVLIVVPPPLLFTARPSFYSACHD